MAQKITKKALKAEKAEKALKANPNSSNNVEPASTSTAFANNKNIMWVILSGAVALLITALLFFPQNLGGGITSVYSLMLWWGLFAMFLFTYIDKKGALGFIAGSIFGMLLQIFSPLLISLT